MTTGSARRKSKPLPAGLDDTTAGGKFWRDVTRAYDLRLDELLVLEQACHEADLCARLQDEVNDGSLTTMGSQGQVVAAPCVSELRQHRGQLRQLVAQLKLPEPAEDAGAGAQPDRATAASAAGSALVSHRWKR